MSGPLTVMEELLNRLDEDLRELWEERAAIMEFDGGLSREHAECLALLNVVLRHPMALSGVRLLRLEKDGETIYLLTTRGTDELPSCTEIDDPANVMDTVFGSMAKLMNLRLNR